MKINKIVAFSFVAGSMLIVGQACQANFVNLTTTYLPGGYGPISIVQGGPLAVKTSSQGDSQLQTWAQTEVGLQNNSSLPSVGGLLFKDDSSPSQTGLNLSAYVGDYLVAHWGNGQANKLFSTNPKGGFDQLFYITAGSISSINLITPELSGKDKDGNTKSYDTGGLSFWSIYGGKKNDQHVPDGGATVALLGFALVGIQIVRSKLQH